MPGPPNGDSLVPSTPEDDHTDDDVLDLVEFTVSVNALLRRARRLLEMAKRGMPKRLLMMETAMTAESASRVAVLLAKSSELLDEDCVTDVYRKQYTRITEED